jgi:hypothetical protein
MSRTSTPLSPYLESLLEENLLLAPEAEAAARLPEELQEKAVELSEALRPPNMEKIVSDLLNPKEVAPPAKHQKPSGADIVVGTLFLILMGWAIISGMTDVSNVLWDTTMNVGKAAVMLIQHWR